MPRMSERFAGLRGGSRSIWARSLLVILCCSLFGSIRVDAAPPAPTQTLNATAAVGDRGFRLAAWEEQALAQKALDIARRPGRELTPAGQHDLVVAYFAGQQRLEQLDKEITAIYADPNDSDPRSVSAPKAAEREQLRSIQAAARPAVEAILQNQVAGVLRTQSLDTAGLLWPPVVFQFTESPDVLVLSPRNKIDYQKGIILQPGLGTEQMEQIERRAEADNPGYSALVEGTGGFSAYPTMVVAYPDLSWVVDTVAHEWSHTYLVFYPLGWHYFDDANTRTLNETTASIIGNEVGQAVVATFYPERTSPPAPARTEPSPAPPRFDFGATMRETRLKTDALLEKGQVTEAEVYMEQQRQILVSHGYAIRKLNQAYFAFHGSYAVGETATDPIGDKLRTLRKKNASLADFVRQIRGLHTVAELDRLLN
jgi:hypothetical protein